MPVVGCGCAGNRETREGWRPQRSSDINRARRNPHRSTIPETSEVGSVHDAPAFCDPVHNAKGNKSCPTVFAAFCDLYKITQANALHNTQAEAHNKSLHPQVFRDVAPCTTKARNNSYPPPAPPRQSSVICTQYTNQACDKRPPSLCDLAPPPPSPPPMRSRRTLTISISRVAASRTPPSLLRS